jgi:serine/threonine protein kinase
VRRAVHKESKAVIALKTYEKKNLKLDEAQQAVHNEITTLSQMNHPNIMRLHEVIDQRTQVHLVMECCPGMPLFHHLKKLKDKRMGEQQCKEIMRQLALGVGYMHCCGKVHRDLKLDNILYDSETQKIKIIDFGFSLAARPD